MREGGKTGEISPGENFHLYGASNNTQSVALRFAVTTQSDPCMLANHIRVLV